MLGAHLTRVRNFDADCLHSHLVSDAGVLVHSAIPAMHQALAVAAGTSPCFVGGTLVNTKDGLKPIEEIDVGDLILSYPDDQVPPKRIRQDHEFMYRRVTRTFARDDQQVCAVTVLDFGDGLKETLKATLDHPFHSDREGWVPASKLRFGRMLLDDRFGNLAVATVETTGELSRVYNLEVDEYHTYYVGRVGAWVHNACGKGRVHRS